jgi:hypothetical protein
MCEMRITRAAMKPVYLAYVLLAVIVLLLLFAALAPAGSATIYTTGDRVADGREVRSLG